MLCEIAKHGNFLTTWAALTALALLSTLGMSAWMFRRWYWRPTFAQWQHKSSPEFPAPQMVRREVLQMLKGLVTATACPALALSLTQRGLTKAYCGVGERGVGYLVLSFLAVWIGSDLFEFLYHRLGHVSRLGWKEHRHHHVFFNPSPFAVIADDAFDQLVRSSPMVIFPLVMPINMDLLFFTFAVFFYGYGAYLHWGYELSYPDAHHRWINTSFQHYLHHARSTLHKPLHTGFFFKLWDQIFGSTYEGACVCAKCCVARGERSAAAWARLEKPDYSPLLRPGFWLHGAVDERSRWGTPPRPRPAAQADEKPASTTP
jgi:Delta7-sterol 5-desaturase